MNFSNSTEKAVLTMLKRGRIVKLCGCLLLGSDVMTQPLSAEFFSSLPCPPNYPAFFGTKKTEM
jgi:hypothetical protein